MNKKEKFYKASHWVPLIVIFCGVAVLMFGFESLKEAFLAGKLTFWESHLLTVVVTASLATTVAFFLRQWITSVAEQQRIAAIAFESQDGMLVTDVDKVILRVNSSFTHITGYTAEEAIGKTPRILSSGRHDGKFYAAMWDAIERTGSWHGEIWNRRKSGEEYPEQLTITSVAGSVGKITHYVGTLHDISERKQMEDQIRQLAFYDPLTQLPNRRLFNDRLTQSLAESKRSHRYGALMFLDLDNFKTLNDTQGHAAGDLLLRQTAQRMKACVREVDTVARLGGDEFVVMMGDLNEDKAVSTAQAGRIAEKIRAALAEPYALTVKHEGMAEAMGEYQCTASIGVVIFIDGEGSQEDFLMRADSAMYQAKDAGCNLIRFFEVGG